MHQVILLSGPPGAGKSAVAQAICERFDRMLHIKVDELRHWVTAGYRHPWAGDRQAEEQRLLATRNACAIAREAINLRYAAVIDDVIPPTEALRYRSTIEGIPCYVHMVTLLPDLETSLARDRGRAASIPERVRALHEELTDAASKSLLPGYVLDSTHDSNAALTADRVLDAVASGAALLLTPQER
ncbi:MAG: AAA family ATPase [Dehalococcoidia bacterium]|nr:AAA family ATPase [Dehalococcoidia bacterium]